MSTKYKSSRDVPTSVIIARLKELSDAVTGGRESQGREFTMRIPAECDRDADLVIGEAARRLELQQSPDHLREVHESSLLDSQAYQLEQIGKAVLAGDYELAKKLAQESMA